MAKKSKIFIQLLPVINGYKQQGFTYPEIVVLLKDNHDLDLSVNTLTNYVWRYEKEKMTENAVVVKEQPKQEANFLSKPAIEPSKSANDIQDINADKLETLNAGFNKKQQQKAVVESYFGETPAFDPTKYMEKEPDSTFEMDKPTFEAQFGSEEYKKEINERNAKYFQRPIGLSKLKRN